MSFKMKIETRRDPGRTIDKFDMPIACPECSHETRHTLAELKEDPTLVCPRCAHTFKIESGGTIRQVADGLDDIDRAFDRLGKS